MAALRFVSAGAAHPVVGAVARDAGVAVEGSFGAVGAMLEKFRAGEPCDVLILTHAQVVALTGSADVLPGTAADLGMVPTSIAVRAGDPAPDVGDALLSLVADLDITEPALEPAIQDGVQHC